MSVNYDKIFGKKSKDPANHGPVGKRFEPKLTARITDEKTRQVVEVSISRSSSELEDHQAALKLIDGIIKGLVKMGVHKVMSQDSEKQDDNRNDHQEDSEPVEDAG